MDTSFITSELLLKVGFGAIVLIGIIIYFVKHNAKVVKEHKAASVQQIQEPTQEVYTDYKLKKCKLCGYIGYGEQFRTHKCERGEK